MFSSRRCAWDSASRIRRCRALRSIRGILSAESTLGPVFCTRSRRSRKPDFDSAGRRTLASPGSISPPRKDRRVFARRSVARRRADLDSFAKAEGLDADLGAIAVAGACAQTRSLPGRVAHDIAKESRDADTQIVCADDRPWGV